MKIGSVAKRFLALSRKQRKFSRYDLFLLLGIIVVTLALCLLSFPETASAATTSASRTQAGGLEKTGGVQHSTSQVSSMQLKPQASPAASCQGAGDPNCNTGIGPNSLCDNLGLTNCNINDPTTYNHCQANPACKAHLADACRKGLVTCNNGMPTCDIQTYDSPCLESINDQTNVNPLYGTDNNNNVQNLIGCSNNQNNQNGQGNQNNQNGQGNQNTLTTQPQTCTNALMFFTSNSITVDNATVKAVWTIALRIVDVFMIALLMLNGLTIMLGGTIFRYDKVVEALPGVLLALIAAHSSLFIVTFFLSLNNTISVDLYKWTADPAQKQLPTLSGVPARVHFMLPYVFTSDQIAGGADEFFVPPNIDPKNQQLLQALSRYIPDMGHDILGPNVTQRTLKDKIGIVSQHVLQTPKLFLDPAGQQQITVTVPDPLVNQPDHMANKAVGTEVHLQNCYPTGQPTSDPNEVQWVETYSANTPNSNIYTLVSGAAKDDNGMLTDAWYARPLLAWSCDVEGTDVTNQISFTANTLNFDNLLNVDPTNPGLTISSIKTLTDVFPLLIKTLGLMLLGQWIVRYFFINLYIVMAPVGIAAWALPGRAGQPLTRLWLSGFLSVVLVQFLQLVAILITQFMLGAILGYVYQQLGLANTDPATSVLSIDVLVNIMKMVVLWFIFRIPSLLGTAPMRSLVDVGQAMSQVVSTSMGMQVQSAQLSISSFYAQEGIQLAQEGQQQGLVMGGLGLLVGVGGVAAMFLI